MRKRLRPILSQFVIMGIPVMDRGCRVFFQRILQFRWNPGSDFQKNVAIRARTNINLVLKFQVDRACFHGEEASAKKRQKSEKDKEKEKERIEHFQ